MFGREVPGSTALGGVDYRHSVLTFLLGPDVRGLLSCDEIAREMGDFDAAIDALDRLQRAGLVHRLGDYAFVSRAAREFDDLVG